MQLEKGGGSLGPTLTLLPQRSRSQWLHPLSEALPPNDLCIDVTFQNLPAQLDCNWPTGCLPQQKNASNNSSTTSSESQLTCCLWDGRRHCCTLRELSAHWLASGGARHLHHWGRRGWRGGHARQQNTHPLDHCLQQRQWEGTLLRECIMVQVCLWARGMLRGTRRGRVRVLGDSHAPIESHAEGTVPCRVRSLGSDSSHAQAVPRMRSIATKDTLNACQHPKSQTRLPMTS